LSPPRSRMLCTPQWNENMTGVSMAIEKNEGVRENAVQPNKTLYKCKDTCNNTATAGCARRDRAGASKLHHMKI